MVYETVVDMQKLTAVEAIGEAISLANLGALPEGPTTQANAIALAQAYALISIAKSLIDVTGDGETGRLIRTYDKSRS